MWEGLDSIELLLWKMFLLLVPFVICLVALTGMRFWVHMFCQSMCQIFRNIKALLFA